MHMDTALHASHLEVASASVTLYARDIYQYGGLIYLSYTTIANGNQSTISMHSIGRIDLVYHVGDHAQLPFGMCYAAGDQS